MSKNIYNILTNLVTVCPITSFSKEHPLLVPIYNEKLHAADKAVSLVYILQVHLLDCTEQSQRETKYIDTVVEEKFMKLLKSSHQFFR